MRSDIDVSPDKTFEKLIRDDKYYMSYKGRQHNVIQWVPTEESDYAFPVSLKKDNRYTHIDSDDFNYTTLYNDYDMRMLSARRITSTNTTISYRIEGLDTVRYKTISSKTNTSNNFSAEINYSSVIFYDGDDDLVEIMYPDSVFYKGGNIKKPYHFNKVPWNYDKNCIYGRMERLNDLRAKHHKSFSVSEEEDLAGKPDYLIFVKKSPIDDLKNSEVLLVEREIDETEYYKVFFNDKLYKLDGVRFCPWLTYLDLMDLHKGKRTVNYVSSNNLKSILYGKRDELDHIRNESKESNRFSDIESWVIEEFIESAVELDSISTSNHPTLNSI